MYINHALRENFWFYRVTVSDKTLSLKKSRKTNSKSIDLKMSFDGQGKVVLKRTQ